MVAFLAVLSTLPLWFVETPPLVDLLGHMGRYYIEIHQATDPDLARNWAFHWALTGNLGFDLLEAVFAPLLGVPATTKILAMLLAPLLITGMARISNAVHGRVTPTLALAAPMALSFPFQYGFLNYCLAWGLGLHLFATWVRLDRKGSGGWVSFCLMTPGLCLVWLCHVYGWAILSILIGSYELVCIEKSVPQERRRRFLLASVRMAGLALPAALTLAWRQASTGPLGAESFDWGEKLVSFLVTLNGAGFALDISALIVVFIGILFFWRAKNSLRLDPSLALAVGLLLIAEALLPQFLLGSKFADSRLWPVILSLAALAPLPAPLQFSRAPQKLVSLCLLCGSLFLFGLRLGVMTVRFHEIDKKYQATLAALDEVPRGASIAVLYAIGCDHAPSWDFYPRFAHLGDLAILKKNAFVNSEWGDEGAQLLHPRHAEGTGFNKDPSQVVSCESVKIPDVEGKIAVKIRSIPEKDYDFVWFMGMDSRRLPQLSSTKSLYSTPESALYSLRAVKAAYGR